MSKWWRATGILRNTAATSVHRTYHTIQAIPREIFRHRIFARERARGRIPIVVFTQTYVQKTPNEPTSIDTASSVSQKLLLTIEAKQIKAILKDIKLLFFCWTTFPLQIRVGSGSSTIIQNGKVLLIKIHRDDDGNILNLVFLWAEDRTKLKVDVPIVYKGEDAYPGLKKGGTLHKIRTSLKYLCPSEHIPPKIEVDVSNLDIEDQLSMHDIMVHLSLKLLSKNKTIPICKIKATNTEATNTTS